MLTVLIQHSPFRFTVVIAVFAAIIVATIATFCHGGWAFKWRPPSGLWIEGWIPLWPSGGALWLSSYYRFGIYIPPRFIIQPAIGFALGIVPFIVYWNPWILIIPAVNLAALYVDAFIRSMLRN